MYNGICQADNVLKCPYNPQFFKSPERVIPRALLSLNKLTKLRFAI